MAARPDKAAASSAEDSSSAQVSRITSIQSGRSATTPALATTPSVGEFAYPHGHLGHLTTHQSTQLDRFKAVLAEKGVWRPGPPPSHEDTVLLRFLRARKWVVDDAYKQFKETEDWRAANDINVLYETIELDAYESSRRMYPQWTGRRDRRGIPLYVYEISHLDSKTVAAYEKKGTGTFSHAKTDGKTPSGLLRLFALYENLTRFNMPFCTQLTDREHPDVPITMSTNIVDVGGTGIKQFWNLKGHMQVASQLATAHYPETLDRIFIIGAPFFFTTVWGWIKRWFDPITVSKIFVLAHHEVLPTLEAFVDRRNIPKKYGGDLDFKFGQLSIPDPAWDGVVAWEPGYSSFPSGPLLWEEVDGGERMRCIGLGYEDGKPRKTTICTIPKTFLLADVATEANGTSEKTMVGEAASHATSEGTQTAEGGVKEEATQTPGVVVVNGDAPEARQTTNSDEKQTAVNGDVAVTPSTAVA